MRRLVCLTLPVLQVVIQPAQKLCETALYKRFAIAPVVDKVKFPR
jgi:hypothetical protein